MVSGSCACTSITNPKSVGRFPLISRHDSPASSERMTSQCFCMKSTFGRDRCSAMRWTQWPTSAVGSGMYCERRPWLIGFQVVPPSSERKAPAAEMATCIRRGLLGSSRIVWRHIPPAPGCHLGPVPWPRRPASSCHVVPPSLVRNRPASSTPAYTVSGSVSDGSRCQTRLNSQGCCVPSYHWCVVSGLPVPADTSYTNLLLSPAGMPSGPFVTPPPGVSHVLPPSHERWITCPNHPLDCDAYRRSGSAGDPFM